MVIGGLKLRNPFVSLQAMQEPFQKEDPDRENLLEIWKIPMRRVAQAEQGDEAAYHRAKEKWEQTAITTRD